MKQNGLSCFNLSGLLIHQVSLKKKRLSQKVILEP